MDMIVLTLTDDYENGGKSIYITVDKIMSMIPYRNCTEIRLVGTACYTVKETIDSIIQMLNKEPTTVPHRRLNS